MVTTAHADRFIGPLTFRTLSGRPVLSDLFDPQSPEAVEHVALAERAQALVVAPATANLLARAAHGIADDFLTTLLLAARCPVLMAPAMDGGMWDHPAVTANVRTLRERGVTVLEPDAGALASGLSGRGRLPEVDAIVEAIERLLAPRRDLAGERVLVTSGPTREPIDPVRYLSNRSSGKMGHAVATAALRRGAEVILISGPTALTPPAGAVYVPVQTAEEMREAALQHLDRATIVIKAAAVGDYRARAAERDQDQVEEGRGARPSSWCRTPTSCASWPPARAGAFLVGFAAETNDVRAQRRRQARRQGHRSPRRQRRQPAGHRLRGRRQPGDPAGPLGRRGRPAADEQARRGRRHPRPGARPARGRSAPARPTAARASRMSDPREA